MPPTGDPAREPSPEARRLADVLRKPDTVLFVGAGVGCWSGLPTWPELIAELADYLAEVGRPADLVRRELDRNDLLQAAGYGFDQLTPQERGEFLHRACRHGDAQPSPLHERLATLPPRCFITTNYDKLLERAIDAARPAPAKVVTNTQLVETATIIQSRARDFVFKPHGDIDTVDSVILTREQYRALHGEKRHVYDAFKTLLASRPVVFVGFGLRDPDFLLIKDTLATVYQGAAQDQYAIVPDVDAQEATYWRRHYGIHLVSYDTCAAGDGPGRSHAPLLGLLDVLAGPAAPAPSPPDLTLTLLRHARRIQQLAPEIEDEEIPLSASMAYLPASAVTTYEQLAPLQHVERAVDGLREMRAHVLLTGAPGAGKSFVVRTAAAEMAETMVAAALDADSDLEDARVPTYVDLRDYAGDLWQLVIDSFPVGLPVDELVAAGRVTFFLDGLNEVPAGAVEDNSLRDDLAAFLSRIGRCSAVVVTRFRNEHPELELLELELGAIPRRYVRERLERLGLPPGELSVALVALLQRPVFHRFYFRDGLVGARTPHGVYTALLARTASRASERFGQALDLEALLGEMAFECVERGNQLIPTASLTELLAESLGTTFDPDALINWLVADGLLVPRRDGHVSFFHHSILEHLAASHLAARFRRDPAALRTSLRARRWDHAILLTLGFLAPAEQQALFDGLMAADATLGLRALAFVEDDWERWTDEALCRIAADDSSIAPTWELGRALEGVRIAERHEPLLLQLSGRGDRLGGSALALTLRFGGDVRVRRALDALFERPSDYGFCAAVVEQLAPRVRPADLGYVVERLAAHPVDEGMRDHDGMARLHPLISASGLMLSSASPRDMAQLVGPLDEAPRLVRHGFANMLQRVSSPEAIALSCTLLVHEPRAATNAISFQLDLSEDPLGPGTLDPATVGPLLVPVLDTATGGPAVEVLQILTTSDPAWRSWVRARAAEEGRGLRAALLWLATDDDERFFELLTQMHAAGADFTAEPLQALTGVFVSWAGRETLLVSLLRERDEALAAALLDSFVIWFIEGDPSPDDWEIGDPVWWLDWMAEQDGAHRLCERLGTFVGFAASSDLKGLLRVLVEGTLQHRSMLCRYVLAGTPHLTLSDLSPEMVAAALDDLRRMDPSDPFAEPFLGRVATEELVEETILPLLATAEEPLRSNLVEIVEHSGQRHRRRYLTETDELLA